MLIWFDQFILYQSTRYAYNLWLHPLAGFPGPIHWRLSRVPFEYTILRGFTIPSITHLHAIYGPIVRIAPNTLAFDAVEAWPDIFGHKPGGLPFAKDPLRHTQELWIHGAQDIFTADENYHGRLRRALKPVFGAQELRKQEGNVRNQVDLLIRRLGEMIDAQDIQPKEAAASGQAVSHEHPMQTKPGAIINMNKYLEWVTFDVIGDLAFGESFACLERGGDHPWLSMIYDSLTGVSIIGAVKQFPLLDALWKLTLGRLANRVVHSFHALVIEKVDRRLAQKNPRNDFMDFILKGDTNKYDKDTMGNERMSLDEIYSNSALLMMAGFDTSSTSLAGIVYHLAKHQDIQKSLKDKIRTRFRRPDEISFQTSAGNTELLAALHESMRVYPNTPFFNPRIVPKGGSVICGKWVPEKVS